MSGGYRPGQPPTELAGLIDELSEITRRLDVLERPSGEQLAQTVKELTALVDDIQTQLDDYIATGTYNKAQIDAKIASPGNIAPGNVTASGTVSGNWGGNFPAGLSSTGAYGTNIGGGGAYVAAWIHNDGRVGFVPSTRQLKTDIKPPDFTLDDILKLQGFFFKYWADPPYSQDSMRVNFGQMAEDADAAGFDFMVDYRDGKPYGIRHDIVAAVALEGLRMLIAEVRENSGKRR